MKELPERIHDDTNSLDYVLVGDYYIPALRLTEESRPIGHWGRRRKAYLEEARPALYCSLLLSGKLWTHLADVDEQAQDRCNRAILSVTGRRKLSMRNWSMYNAAGSCLEKAALKPEN